MLFRSEQYSRRCCLEIQGIPCKDNENTEEVVVYLIRQLGINITGPEISVAHRLAPSNDSNKNPAIIVKFLSQKLRDTIYHKRWKLNDINNKTGNDGFKVFINESLTKANKEVFKAGLSFKKRFHFEYVWTNHCLTGMKTIKPLLLEGLRTSHQMEKVLSRTRLSKSCM